MSLSRLLAQITPPDPAAAAAAQSQWDAVAKPLGSLGLLEETVVRMAALTGSTAVQAKPRTVLVFCGDNGVVEEGVTQTGSEITALVAGNIARGEASVCHMAALADAAVLAIDMGMLTPVPGCLDRRVAPGTRNIAKGPAMSRDQAVQAVLTGAELVREQAAQGARLIVTGEMGIGNTTTASAVSAVLLDLEPETVAGRGAGLSDSGLARKRQVIRQALAINRPDPADPLDVLAKLGGFDIAGMAGAFLGGAAYRVPVLIDGVISAAAALLACRLCPGAKQAIFATHCSDEPAAALLLAALGLSAPIHAGLRLGEGSGAVCFLPMLDMALSVYEEMVSFRQIGMEPYAHQGEKK